MVDEIALARDRRKGRDIEMEVDAQVIREARISGMPSKEFKLLKELKAAAQSFVDEMAGAWNEMRAQDVAEKHEAWFRELLK